MYLQYYINENGDKVYTVKKESPLGKATESAHPVTFHFLEVYASFHDKLSASLHPYGSTTSKKVGGMSY
ncbi:H/ACA ribonucleocomplex subunit 3-like protein [Nymphaea thermarum]|nr:H/ACA ribonucleocomplex subunit 3-like protein [Nymphaea thermarum]